MRGQMLIVKVIETVLWKAGVRTKDNVVFSKEALEDMAKSVGRQEGVIRAWAENDELRVQAYVDADCFEQ